MIFPSASSLSYLICRSAEASKSKDKTLSSLERYQQVSLFVLIFTNIIFSLQFFTEEKTSSLLSSKGLIKAAWAR